MTGINITLAVVKTLIYTCDGGPLGAGVGVSGWGRGGGGGVGLSAEGPQSLLPMLERRPSLANVGQNAVGAWAGAAVARYLLHRLHPRSASR